MTDLALSTVMLRQQPPDAVVYTDGERVTDVRAFRLRVRQWMAIVAGHPARVWAVYLEDAGEFAALMMALWQCQKTPLLAGDNLPSTVERLFDYADALVGSFPAGTRNLVPPPENEALAADSRFVAVPRDHDAAIVLTSGSTGDPRPVAMSVAQLEDEVTMHETQWRCQAGGALVIGTVTHQHVYGLIWRVLWPLAGGRPFASHYAHYPEDLMAWARKHQALVLVTTPSHLGRLSDLPDWAAVRKAWHMVVSSTAPLSSEDSQMAGDRFGVPVTEIFGSSETGGIAWRRQQQDPVWQALPGITVGLDQPASEGDRQGPLLIRSPLVREEGWFATGDRAFVESERRFTLLGRVDRIAKIEGKRVSLTAMERCLADHAWVEDARLVVLGGHRTRCAVVATLTPAGIDQLDAAGRRSLSQALRHWLADTFEAPVLPRHWRFPVTMPRNAQGKVPQSLLADLFRDQSIDQQPDDWPQILSTQVVDNEVVLRLQVQQGLTWFDGHFPDLPVVPGVVQIHWADRFARQYLQGVLPPSDHFRRSEAVKFLHVIQPGQALTMALSWDAGNGRLAFRYYHGDTVFSSGKMVFEGPGEQG